MNARRSDADGERDPFFDSSRDITQPLGPRFQVLGRLGEGGMGEVFRVRDRELNEVVALKLIARDRMDDPEQIERLRREVRLARRVSSARVCRIHDLVELPEGRRGVTMELIQGRSLAKLVSEGFGEDWSKIASIAGDIAEGLGAAHAIGVVHRDLKPENVMVDPDGRAVILDFGVAIQREPSAAEPRLTEEGMILGTLLYMAPEHLTAAKLDNRADLYALGLIIAEMCTGEVPFGGSTYGEILSKRVVKPSAYDLAKHAPGAPEALVSLVGTLLAHDRESRPASTFFVMEELRAIARGEEGISVEISAAWAKDTARRAEAAPMVSDTVPTPGARRSTGPRAEGPKLGPVLGLVGALLAALVGLTIYASIDTTPQIAPRAERRVELEVASPPHTLTSTGVAVPASPTPSSAPKTPRPSARLPEAEEL
ncbi:MAG: serine/threonine-protein kinase [Myxococcota bacterium]